MLRHLVYREMGFHTPQVLRKLEVTKRTYALDLSQHKEIVNCHGGCITALDMDVSDRR